MTIAWTNVKAAKESQLNDIGSHDAFASRTACTIAAIAIEFFYAQTRLLQNGHRSAAFAML